MSGRKRISWTHQDGYLVVQWVEILDDEDGTTPDDDLWPELMLVMECLTEKQRWVIECRYGLKDGNPLTQPEVASLMGVSQQAVAKIEARAVAKMRGVVRES